MSRLRKPKKREASVEDAYVEMLPRLGLGKRLKTRKMNGLGNASWPDRLIIGPRGFVLWIEFKRPGKLATLTVGQSDLHEDLRAMGHAVQVHDDAEEAFVATKNALAAHGVVFPD